MPFRASSRASRRSPVRRVAEWVGVAALAGILGGCGAAESNDGGKSSMIFGLFKSKYTTTVRPELGGALQRETAYPAVSPPPAPSYPTLRNVSADAPPPAGTLATERKPQPPAEAFIVDAGAGQPAVALVNTYGAKQSTGFWEVQPGTPARFGKARTSTIDPAQSKWIMWSSEGVLALPSGRILFHLKYHDPRPVDALFLYDIATDRVRRFADVTPDWPRGLPLQYLASLQVRPDTVLVRYGSDKERIGPQRYVNHFDHLVLFSPRHPDGLEIATAGLDDGSVRRWGVIGSRLWLETGDDRANPPRSHVWSLDLTPVL